MWSLNFSIILPIKSSYVGVKCPQTSSCRAGHGWGWTVWLTLPLCYNACQFIWRICISQVQELSAKKQVSGSLIRSLASAGTSAFRKSLLSCDFPDKAAPGAQHLHQLLSRHSLAGGPGVRNAVVNPPCPGFSASLILTAKSQPCLLPLIAWVAQRVPCPLGTSNLQLSGSFTIIDMQLKDYLVTLEGFCFVCSWTSIPACIK